MIAIELWVTYYNSLISYVTFLSEHSSIQLYLNLVEDSINVFLYQFLTQSWKLRLKPGGWFLLHKKQHEFFPHPCQRLLWLLLIPKCTRSWTLIHSLREENNAICIKIHYLFYLTKTYFFRSVLGLQQNWEEDTEISHIAPALHMHNLPHYQHLSPRVVRLLKLMSVHWHIIITQRP